jgi:hypothetical protein
MKNQCIDSIYYSNAALYGVYSLPLIYSLNNEHPFLLFVLLYGIKYMYPGRECIKKKSRCRDL